MNVGVYVLFLGLILFIVGLFLMFIEMKSRETGGKVETGAVVIIGPVPIVFGSNRAIAKDLMIFALVLTLMVFLAYVLMVVWQ
ncbi:MAG: TIGR00304 family membrane protein [Infirmifilum sp.]